MTETTLAADAAARRDALVERPTSHHHFAVAVDEVEPVYQAAERREAFDYSAFGNHLVELPGDLVQLYVRDPAGNLVEIDSIGVERLPDELRAQLKHLRDFHPQDDENMRARLSSCRSELPRAVAEALRASASREMWSRSAHRGRPDAASQRPRSGCVCARP